MAMTTSLSPIKARAFGLVEARHLLRRAGFGPEPGQAEALVKLGLDRAVDQLVDYNNISTADLPKPPVDPDVLQSVDR